MAQMGPPPGGPPPGGKGPGNGPMGAGLPTLFLSPSGQPFRAAGGEPYPVAAWFAQADKDHDGKISQAEFTNDAKLFFVRLDANHDGYINSPENTAYETKIAPEITHTDPRVEQPVNHVSERDPNMGVDQDPTHGRYQMSIQGASQFSLLDQPQPVRAADANFDFRISGQEWLDATDARFTALDRNNDGFLTLDELPKTPLQYAIENPKKEKARRERKKVSAIGKFAGEFYPSYRFFCKNNLKKRANPLKITPVARFISPCPANCVTGAVSVSPSPCRQLFPVCAWRPYPQRLSFQPSLPTWGQALSKRRQRVQDSP